MFFKCCFYIDLFNVVNNKMSQTGKVIKTGFIFPHGSGGVSSGLLAASVLTEQAQGTT